MKKKIVDISEIPKFFPTHLHEPAFWEALGRAVATFGFLEEVLGKAIFALSGTKEYSEEEIDEAYETWLRQLEKALHDPLGGLINSYERAMRDHQDDPPEDFDVLIDQLKGASKLRNVLCHASWPKPDEHGNCVPSFVNRQMERFETRVSAFFLNQTGQNAAELACAVISSVTVLGYEFPGSSSGGKRIM